MNTHTHDIDAHPSANVPSSDTERTAKAELMRRLGLVRPCKESVFAGIRRIAQQRQRAADANAKPEDKTK